METSAIIGKLKDYDADLRKIRHDIHQNPETAFEEVRTAKLVAEHLRSWGIDVTDGIAKTGVVGTLKGKRPGQRAIGLRADLDALHIPEATGKPYSSLVPGKMHACGHDGHTTMLLGAARYLAENPDFGGTVHFIFQPAEENLGGGREMVNEGLFDRFPVDAVYGMHNAPGLPVGKFAIRSGPFLAASDTWTVIFRGTGGHGGAGAHLSTDPTVPLGHFILALQTIIGRSVPAIETAVISVGHIKGGEFGAPNIIPSETMVRGTARCYKPQIRDLLERRMGELAQSLAAAYGCTAELNYERQYPPLVNHSEETDVAAQTAAGLVGDENVNTNAPIVTGSEDFAYMLEARPGSFIMIGNGVAEDGTYHNVHTPLYDFNDEILTLGSAYWINLVNNELSRGAEGAR